MITYIVRCKRYTIDMREDTLTGASIAILNSLLFEGDDVSGDSTLKHISQEEDSKAVFDEGIPLERRRAAMRRAASWGEMIIKSGEYNDFNDLMGAIQDASEAGQDFVKMVQQHLGGIIKVFDVGVYMCYKGKETRLHGIVYNVLGEDETTLNALTQELSIYEEHGYDIGAAFAFVKYVPGLNRVVCVLPDAAPYFSSSQV